MIKIFFLTILESSFYNCYYWNLEPSITIEIVIACIIYNDDPIKNDLRMCNLIFCHVMKHRIVVVGANNDEYHYISLFFSKCYFCFMVFTSFQLLTYIVITHFSSNNS